MRFSELLIEAVQVPGIRRVRFTTSHPRDFTPDIIAAMDCNAAICNHVHLPVQSGSTRVLRAMQRTYSRDEYLEKIAMIRSAKRRTAITTDVIVGFPGETNSDFDETLSLLDEVKYDGVFFLQVFAEAEYASFDHAGRDSGRGKEPPLGITSGKATSDSI